MEKELSGYSTKASSGAAGTRAGSTQRTAMLSQVAALLLPKGREERKESVFHCKLTLHPVLVALLSLVVRTWCKGKPRSVIHQEGQGTCLGSAGRVPIGAAGNLCGSQSTPYHTEEMKRGVNCGSLSTLTTSTDDGCEGTM